MKVGSSRPVRSIHIKSGVTKDHLSVKGAAEYTGSNPSCIAKVASANNRRKSANGYKFEYLEPEEQKPLLKETSEYVMGGKPKEAKDDEVDEELGILIAKKRFSIGLTEKNINNSVFLDLLNKALSSNDLNVDKKSLYTILATAIKLDESGLDFNLKDAATIGIEAEKFN